VFRYHLSQVRKEKVMDEKEAPSNTDRIEQAEQNYIRALENQLKGLHAGYATGYREGVTDCVSIVIASVLLYFIARKFVDSL
jgi:hypothetical protein